MRVAGIYLAAGAGSRMGGSKLSIPLGASGKLGGFALEAALASSLDSVFVVTRPGAVPDWLPPGYFRAEREGRAARVVCDDAALGMAHSLRAGLEAACSEGEPGAVVVLLADQPLVSAGMIDRLTASFREQPQLDYCAAGLQGNPCPPVLLARRMFPAVAALEGDQGARALLKLPHYSGGVQEEPEPHRLWDADTPGDVERIRTFCFGG